MTKTSLLSLIAITFLLFAASCTKKGDTGPIGPAGPAYKGTITGHVSIYDQYGSKLLTGFDKLEVSLKGGRTVNPDSHGYYFFDTVATGNYTITVSGTAVGAMLLNNVPFLKDTLYQDIKLSAKPVFNLNTFMAYHNPGSIYDSLVITVDEDTRLRYCIVFVGNSDAVSNLPSKYLLAYTVPITPNSTLIRLKVPAGDLNNAGIFYNDPVYFMAYSYVVGDASVYEDRATGNNVYNAVGSTPILSSTICP